MSNLPNHLRQAVESSQCPSNLSSLEKIVWATERRRRYESGIEDEPEQPKHVRTEDGLSATPEANA